MRALVLDFVTCGGCVILSSNISVSVESEHLSNIILVIC